jgi:hypothetical protein
MKKRILPETAIFLFFGLVIIAIVILFQYSDKYVFEQNYIKYLQQLVGKELVVQKELKVTYDEKNFLIILCSPVMGPKNETHVQVFEEKMGGLFYKPTYGSSKGKSRSLHGMMINFTRPSLSNNFRVVYGYNKDFQAYSYEVKKVNSDEIIKEDISDQEYFLQTYQDIVYPKVIFKDKDNKDISEYFINGM